MKILVAAVILFSLNTPLFAQEFESFSGLVTRLKDHMTIIYRVGDLSVARGSEKHLKAHVNKQVNLRCKIKRGRIIYIKSVSVISTQSAPVPTLNTLYLLYKDDPVKTAQTYRSKVLNYNFKATGIKIHSPREYVIFLEGMKGKLIVKKDSLPAQTIKTLWDMKHSKRAKRNRQLKEKKAQPESIMISFKGKWVGNLINTLIFKMD